MSLFNRDELRIVTLLQQLSLLRMEALQPQVDQQWLNWIHTRIKEVIEDLKEE